MPVDRRQYNEQKESAQMIMVTIPTEYRVSGNDGDGVRLFAPIQVHIPTLNLKPIRVKLSISPLCTTVSCLTLIFQHHH